MIHQEKAGGRAADTPPEPTPIHPDRHSRNDHQDAKFSPNRVKADDTARGDDSAAEWRPIPGYVDLYEATRDGEIRSLDRTVETARGPWTYRGRQLRPVGNSGTVFLHRRDGGRAYCVRTLARSAWGGTPCVVCETVVSTRPRPWTCSECGWAPPPPEPTPVDLDAVLDDEAVAR